MLKSEDNVLMLKTEENIVNIAMMAQRMLDEGKIETDGIEGFTGLTVTIVQLAHNFEKEYGHIDYSAEVKPGESVPDYWEDIDNFAIKHLSELYGREDCHVDKEPLETKISAAIDMCKHSDNTDKSKTVPGFNNKDDIKR